ncbi:MAG: MlaD family protein, partial [Pseudomonadota bacterium]
MKRSFVEIILGAIVLIAAGLFVVHGYHVIQRFNASSYELNARFPTIEGLRQGADVRISGVKVGVVEQQYIDPKTYESIVVFTIRSDLQLPVDSVVTIASNGLLGSKFVRIEPGSDPELLDENAFIAKTRAPLSIENLLSRVIFLVSD